MKWIKASERLPIFSHKTISRFIHTQTPLFEAQNFAIINPDKVNEWEWLDESTPPVSAMQDGFTDYRIYHNDKVNSILAAAIRFLNTEQLVVLKDCLIERTPKK